ncbi:MAG: MarR family winged helix-turn-helix transcriptional regulator [Chloroflexota bacterium]
MTRRTQQPATPGPADESAALIERILAEYEPVVARTRRVMAGVWQDRKVGKTTLAALLLLEQHGPIPMSRLAGLLDASLPNATGIVARMVDLGLAERVRDAQDRRIVRVRATERGCAAVAEMEALRRDHVRRLLTTMDAAELDACLRAFRALRAASERIDPGPDPGGGSDPGAPPRPRPG